MNKENQRNLHNGKSKVEIKSKTKQAALLSQKRSSSTKEQYQLYMKYLIATNSEYFQNKMKVTQVGKPKQIKFKIPSKTGSSVYKRDYHQQQNKYPAEEGIRHDMSVDCIKTNNFLRDQKLDNKLTRSTMYQSEFKNHPGKCQTLKASKKRIDTLGDCDDDVPRFFETQNKLDFLNWAGKNSVTSMKPEQRPAVTNAHFGATSVYKSDFQGKSSAKTPNIIRQPSIGKFGCASSVMKTSYNDDYSTKKVDGPQIDCKPRYFEATLCKRFKGSTEYKRQYRKTKKSDDEEYTAPTLQELQTLIIDL